MADLARRFSTRSGVSMYLAVRVLGTMVSAPASRQKYLRRMQAEAPKLLASNVNHWFKETPERRMVRTLDGNIRAFLSDRYMRVDNTDVAEAVLPVLQFPAATPWGRA
jgi:hypothetical protein